MVVFNEQLKHKIPIIGSLIRALDKCRDSLTASSVHTAPFKRADTGDETRFAELKKNRLYHVPH